jgi:hypothetical protein
MVIVTKTETDFIFKIKGLHKFWAFKKQISIPINHIIKSYPFIKNPKTFLGFRMPGTFIPWVITAGTYVNSSGTYFYDMMSKKKTIIVELNNEHYTQLIIEVENPTETMALINTN